MSSKTIFITRATSGTGAACAEKFALAGHRLILCGRRTEHVNVNDLLVMPTAQASATLFNKQ